MREQSGAPEPTNRLGLFACCYAAEFPAQAMLRLRPNLQGKPIAVLAGAAPHERVCAANAAARRDGVRNGMTRVEAESFAGITLLRRSEREEASARTAMLGSAGSFTPMVEVVETRQSELAAMCVLDIAGMTRLYAEPRALARALREALLGRGIHASIAVSANFHTACLLAHGKPGITVVPAGEEQAALASLLLAGLSQALELEEEQAQTLALWGVRTLGALAMLPQKQLIARMGQAGKRLRELARGEHPHLFAPVPVPWELREEFHFEAPVRLLEGVLFVLSPMLEQLVAQARERALALATVTVTFVLDGRAMDAEDDSRADASLPAAASSSGAIAGSLHLVASDGLQKYKAAAGKQTLTARTTAATEAQRNTSRTIRPTVPTQNKRLLLKLLQLELAARPPGAPVLSVVVEAEAAKIGAVQSGLFSPPLPEPSRLDVTIARLKAMVGEARVGSPALRDTHASDSFLMRAFGNTPATMSETNDEGKRMPVLRQLRPPEPVQVHTESGQPVGFWFRGALYRVHSASGPWRMSGAWWSGDAWSHECWDVAAEHRRSEPSIEGLQPDPQSRSQPDTAQNTALSASARPPLYPFLIHASAPAQQLCCRLRRDLLAGTRNMWCVEGLYD